MLLGFQQPFERRQADTPQLRLGPFTIGVLGRSQLFDQFQNLLLENTAITDSRRAVRHAQSDACC